MYKPNSSRGDHYSNGSSGRSGNDSERRGGGGSGSSFNSSRGGGFSRGGYTNGGGGGGDRESFGNGMKNSFPPVRKPNPNQHDEFILNKPVWNPSNMKPFEKEFYKESSAVRNRPPQMLSDFLRDNNVTVTGSTFIKPILDFSDCDSIPDSIYNRIKEAKYNKPTPIQAMCWPTLISGNDMVGIAQTGSGKTLGFIIPILIHIANNQRYLRAISSNRDDAPGPIALVLAPTRELAIQIQAVAEEFGNYTGIKNIVIYGGASKGPQTQLIRKGAEIYIATPGRLLDFIKETTISLHRCTFLVLDEADRMLDMGFEPQIRKIIEQIRPDRQTAMFSATWPKEVRKLAEDFLANYIQINIGAEQLTANPNIKQIVELCEENNKENRLKEILSEIMRYRDSKAIVFAETKRRVDAYSKFIRELGYHCLTIHGDKKQQEREWVLGEFRKKPKSILCATDVAARGINIEDIKYVINVDYPVQTEDYIHRIGRTARSTNIGTAFTFITHDNSRHVPKLIEVLKEANQYVSDGLLQMSRGSGRQNFNKNFSRGGFQNQANANGGHFSLMNGGQSNQRPKYNPQQAPSFNGQDNMPIGRKRDASPDQMNGHSKPHDSGRVKKFRWDEGPAVHQSNQLMGSNGVNGGRMHSNGGGAHYTNGSRHEKSTPPSSLMNGPPLPPMPTGSHHHQQPPPPPPASSGMPNSSAYPADYSSMYNMQYYQAIAAAAASNGGAGWQAAAGYPNWPPAAAAPPAK